MADLVASLGEVAHCDASIAAHLWALVFPIVWATLSERKEQQIQLAKPIIGLLSKEYHIRQVSTGLGSAFHLVFLGGDISQARDNTLKVDAPQLAKAEDGHEMQPA